VSPDVPRELAEICDCALSLDRSKRFATAADFREALLNVLAEDFQDADHARLGELVSDAFQPERSRIHAVIERHLKAAPLNSSIDDLVASLPEEPAEHTLKADLSELASVSRLRDDAALVEASHGASVRFEQPKPRFALIAGAPLILAAGGLWWIGSRGDSEKETAPPAPQAAVSREEHHVATQPTAAAGQVLLPQTVSLVISANPPEAQLFMDGVPLRNNPYAASVRADGELHLIRAGGPGLQSQERVITLDRERVIAFNLARSPVARSAPRIITKRPPAVLAPLDQGPSAIAAPALSVRPRPADEFDADLTLKAKPREIYDEDPYR
jgi:hypothetical protein